MLEDKKIQITRGGNQKGERQEIRLLNEMTREKVI